MCNHYEKNVQVLSWALNMIPGLTLPAPLPEVATHTWPKYPAPVVVDQDGKAAVAVMRWGVWPFYEKKLTRPLTNARDDGLLTKTVWKQSVARRRCLIPATGYFEPGLGPPGARGELRFTFKGRPYFFFAGLWDTDPDGSGSQAFTMVTTRPNDYAARFHDRMPVVLDDPDALAWLGSSPLPDERILTLCRPAANEQMDHATIEAAPKGKKITRADVQSGELDLG